VTIVKPEEYVSTACRVGEHEECQQRPVVRCACGCHTDNSANGNHQDAPE
jgi:hypothetical protein